MATAYGSATIRCRFEFRVPLERDAVAEGERAGRRQGGISRGTLRPLDQPIAKTPFSCETGDPVPNLVTARTVPQDPNN
jgi:hypothetical protein